MIEVEAVWDLIDQRTKPRPAVSMALADALGFTLAEDVFADRDSPPFDRSTVDGYAIRADDEAAEFLVVGQMAAGEFERRPLERGQAIRIFTGAPLPAEGLRVVMQEDTAREGSFLRLTRRGTGENFCRQGEDFRAGERLLPRGTRIDAAAAAVLASVGRAVPSVARAPRILHFTTGDEIVPPEETPAPGQIRNGNATLIRALLRAFPIDSLRHAHLPDDEPAAHRIIDESKPEAADLILFSGGASVGDFDFTARFLDGLGVERHCAAVNVRPGKPLIFASDGERLAFGLPGNPVSHFVCFHLFVARALARLGGRAPVGFRTGRLGLEIPGRPSPRVTYWPARLRCDAEATVADPVAWNGSGHLASLLGVDALIRLAANDGLPKAGATVQILPVA